MSVTLTPRFRPFKKVLIGVAILAGLISAIFVATRLVLDSLFMDIATQGPRGLPPVLSHECLCPLTNPRTGCCKSVESMSSAR